MREDSLENVENIGRSVVDLLEKRKILPNPQTYKVFYEFVNGAVGIEFIRLEKTINRDDISGQNLYRQIYDDFIRPYENQCQTDNILQLALERIDIILNLIEDAKESASRQSRYFEGATAALSSGEGSVELIVKLVAGLSQINQTALDTNQKLVDDMFRVNSELEHGRSELERLRKGASVDPLTGISNRAGIDAALQDALGNRERSFALAIIDVDHFKEINDTFGHQAGDAVLRTVARALQASVRASEIIGRIGGDEFATILYDVDQVGAQLAGERLRAAVAECDMGTILGKDTIGGVTVSIGVANCREIDTFATIVNRADAGLYEAKRLGRNRSIVSQ